MRKELNLIGKRAAEPVRRAASALAPKRTGQMAASLRIVGSGPRLAVRAGGARAFYARFQEYGTKKMRPSPFMRPAVEQKRSTVVGEYEQGIEAFLGRIFGG